MASLKVSVYEPNGQRYAPRIKEDEWQYFRPIITQLHDGRVPRKVMLKQLRNEYQFEPTIGQLQAKMKEWKLTVYSKDAVQACSPISPKLPESGSQAKPPPSKKAESWLNSAFDLVFSSGYVEEWSDDFRVHPANPSTPNPNLNEPQSTQPGVTLHDRALPPEYLAGGLMANSADPHWPMPTDSTKADAMLKAANYYYALQAYQHAFSLYRTVYLYKRRQSCLEDTQVIFIALRCACSAVTEHQRNIVHSVLTEIGSLPMIDNLDPLLLQCLQSASLSMLSGEDPNVPDDDHHWAWAAAHLKLSSACRDQSHTSSDSLDLKVLLYAFEHSLLIHEHNSGMLVNLLQWCDTAVDRLHYDLDDIFVGFTSCDEEFHRRVAQLLGGHLVKQWSKTPDVDLTQFQLQDALAASFPLDHSELETIVTLAFMIVDAARFCSKENSIVTNGGPSLWYLDAAKNFKRALRFLVRLDTRGRCEGFSRAYLERYYASMTLRHKMYRWNCQVPAIVDSVGISIARCHIFNHSNGIHDPITALSSEPEVLAPTEPLAYLKSLENQQQPLPSFEVVHSPPMHLQNRCTSPVSDKGSITSFLNTHLRTVRKKLVPSVRSRGNASFDAMSAGSVMDWKFSAVTGLMSPTSAASIAGQTSKDGPSDLSDTSWMHQDSPPSVAHYVQDGLFGASNQHGTEVNVNPIVLHHFKTTSAVAISINNSLDFSQHERPLEDEVLDFR